MNEPGVCHLGDAFAHGVPTALVLAVDAVGPAHLGSELLEVGDLGDRVLSRTIPGFPRLPIRIDRHCELPARRQRVTSL